MKEIILNVEGMHCGGCEQRVKNALESIEDVENVVANHVTGIVEITLKEEVAEELIKEKINDIGFKVVD